MVAGFKKDNGTALLEFSVVVVLLLIMFTGIVDLGLGLNKYMALTRAVHEGVLLAAQSHGHNEQDIKDRVLDTLSVYSAASSAYAIDNLTVSPPTQDPATQSVQLSANATFKTILGPQVVIQVQANGPLLR